MGIDTDVLRRNHDELIVEKLNQLCKNVSDLTKKVEEIRVQAAGDRKHNHPNCDIAITNAADVEGIKEAIKTRDTIGITAISVFGAFIAAILAKLIFWR